MFQNTKFSEIDGEENYSPNSPPSYELTSNGANANTHAVEKSKSWNACTIIIGLTVVLNLLLTLGIGITLFYYEFRPKPASDTGSFTQGSGSAQQLIGMPGLPGIKTARGKKVWEIVFFLPEICITHYLICCTEICVSY